MVAESKDKKENDCMYIEIDKGDNTIYMCVKNEWKEFRTKISNLFKIKKSFVW